MGGWRSVKYDVSGYAVKGKGGDWLDEDFRYTSRNFMAVFWANVLYFGSFYLLIPVMPQYVAQLGGSASQVGLVMGWFTLAAVAVRPLFGRLSDHWGRRPLMLAGCGLFAVVFLLYSRSAAVGGLYVWRAVHGVAHACFMAASAAYVADLAPRSRRGEVLGMYGTSNVVAMAVFPAVGNLLIQRTGDFDQLFQLSAVAAAIAAVVLLGTREIVPGATLRREAPLWQVGRRPAVLFPAAALFCVAAAYGAVITFLPLFAVAKGIPEFGGFFSSFAVSTVVSRLLAGRLSDRIGRKTIILPFMLLIGSAAGVLPLVNSQEMLWLAGFLFGLGFGAFLPTLNALVIDCTPPQERGSALGFFTSFMDLGITAGAVGLGLLGEAYGFCVLFGAAAVLVVAGAGIFSRYRPVNCA